MKWQTLDGLNKNIYIHRRRRRRRRRRRPRVDARCFLRPITYVVLCTPLRSFLKSRFSRFHTFLVFVGVRVRLSISFAPAVWRRRRRFQKEDFVVFRGKEKTENYVLMISLDNQISFFIVNFICTSALLSLRWAKKKVSRSDRSALRERERARI